MSPPDAAVVYVAAGAQSLWQFRLPLLRHQAGRFRRLVVYVPEEVPHTALLREAGLEVVAGPVTNRPGPWTPFEIARLARYLEREHFDVLIGHQPMGALVGIHAAVKARVGLRIYSTGGLKFVPGRAGTWNWLMRVGESRLIDRSDYVLCVNREDERLLLADGKTRGKAIYVGPRGGCGIDTERFAPARRQALREPARRELAAGPDDFLIGYSGRLVWEKGLGELVEAVRLLSAEPASGGLRVLVLGAGRDGDGIRARAARAGVGDRFEFLGHRFDVERWLAALDVFVLASRREGLPVALLEALALGLPAVASDVRGSRELVRSGETGLLIPPGDPPRLAAAIAALRADPTGAWGLGARASAEVLGLYGEASLVKKTAATIEELIERHQASQASSAPSLRGGPTLTGWGQRG